MDGSIDVTVNGGVAPYTYNWTSSNGINISSAQSNITSLDTGIYYEYTDNNGCSYFDTSFMVQIH